MKRGSVRFVATAVTFFAIYIGTGALVFGEPVGPMTFVKAVVVFGIVYAVLESRWVKRRFVKTRTD